ncbi:MAG: hypothetical protein KC800_23490 [Candidatus Eremiobacteraeota bacterium]|nr:hypothetical protein [Candidatus Eremiobacteraeota bacterium]
MSLPDAYSMHRFLDSKRTVDDRALNKDVYRRLRSELEERGAFSEVLEVGAGLGNMIARMVEWGLLTKARYTLLDLDTQLLSDSRTWLADWATEQGYAVNQEETLRIVGESLELQVSFVGADLRDYLKQAQSIRADLLIANAFLDLVDLKSLLPDLLGLVKKGGLCWFTINFDGETIFEPAHPQDDELLAVYHQSMDERTFRGQPAGDSRTGRRLFAAMPKAGARILSAGSSDWVVFPDGGSYPHKEAYFLYHILHTIDQELQKHSSVDQETLKSWVQERQRQVEQGELVYIAHQIDLLSSVG